MFYLSFTYCGRRLLQTDSVLQMISSHLLYIIIRRVFHNMENSQYLILK